MAQSDWDFSAAQGVGWEIDTTTYISSPSCLRALASTQVVLAKKVGCTNLPQGQVVSWCRAESLTHFLGIFFRNQAAVGLANYTDTYWMERALNGNSAACIARRFESGSQKWSASFGPLTALSISTWYKFRLTWWIDWGSLRIRLERWNGSAWVQEGSDCIDATNKWSVSAINRPGLYLGYSDTRHDDTEIWGV